MHQGRPQIERNPRARVAGLLLLASVLSACTSLQTYPASQLGPGLPLAAGDDIRLYPAGSSSYAQPKSLRITAIDDKTISGRSADDGYALLTYRWEDLERIEHRVPDHTKTGILGVLIFLMLYAVVDIGDHLRDGFGNDDE